jgi:hypothetical protein
VRGTLAVIVALLLILPSVGFAAADAAKTEPDLPADALRAARVFLRAVADADDKAAYELTAPAYRKDVPRERFASEAKTLRDGVGLPKEMKALPSMSGWVLVNAEEGQPRRGAFTLGNSRRIAKEDAEKLARTTIGVRVEQQTDGRWLVSEARAMDRNRATSFMDSVVDAARHGNDLRYALSTIRGKVIGLKDGAMTIQVDPSPTAPTKQPPDRTIKLDEKAEVVRVTLTPITSKRGQETYKRSFTPGTIADVKAGVRVTIEPAEDDARAASVEVSARASDGL